MLPLFPEDLSLLSAKAAFRLRPFSRTSLRMCNEIRNLGVEPKALIDVGANVGQFSAAAAYLFPGLRVFAFEPLPDAYEALSRVLSGVRGATATNTAVGATQGDTVLHVNEHSHSSSLKRLSPAHLEAFPFAKEVSEIPCTIITLDDYFREIDLPSVTLLKLDVQGAESAVIAGATKVLGRVSHVVCEAAMVELYDGEALIHDLIRQLDGCGFDLFGPLDILRSRRKPRPLQADLLFARRPLAAEKDDVA